MLRRAHKSLRARQAISAGAAASARATAGSRLPAQRSKAALITAHRRPAAARPMVTASQILMNKPARFLATQAGSSTQTHHAAAGPPPAFDTKNALPSKVLIANRGEIACRVMRTCQRLGIRTVAVFSEADRNAAHVAMADEAYCIGPAPSAESYLKMDRIIQVCEATGAEMVHPGYGFLSENAEFANLLAQKGIKFIGPPAQAILSMGSKSASKEIMTNAGVPCVPGYHGTDQSDATLQAEAGRIGYPVLIKAVKGGGGKGMKIVEREQEFLEQLNSARREAIASFGDGDVLVEKYLTKPRHVEVQIVSSGSPHNEHVAISTRDCSVQRRHQKIIEEAPAPFLTPEVEADLCAKAVAAAAAVSYEGAGTVEFILDADTGEAWFLECNTRLQVEHPVSEMVSGIDLVEWQLEAAAGNALPLKQEQVQKRGHAFEARIYAENPRANFLPDVGHLTHVAFPTPTTALLSPATQLGQQADAQVLASIRVDTGVATGDEVSVYYDPMIAKVIVHGRDRTEALRLMRAALAQTHIVGPQTNVAFLSDLCRQAAFIDGTGLETGFISKHMAASLRNDKVDSDGPGQVAAMQAAAFLAIQAQATGRTRALDSPWGSPEFAHFRNAQAQPASSTYRIATRASRASNESEAGDQKFRTVTLSAVPRRPTCFRFDVDGQDMGVRNIEYNAASQTLALPEIVAQPDLEPTAISLRNSSKAKIIYRAPAPSKVAGIECRIDLFEDDDETHSTRHVELDVLSPTWVDEVRGNKLQAKGSVMAPMPSKVVDVRVKSGDAVSEGDVVVVLEAMKTEHTLRAPKDGVVARVTVEKGAMCAEGTELVLFEEQEESGTTS